MDYSMPGLPVHHHLPESTQTHVHGADDAIQPSRHLLALLFPPSFFHSIRVFFNKSALRIRWPKYWSFSFNISPSSEYSGLISFRMDWLDLLAVQGTLKSLLQYHSSKASVLSCSAFFIVQVSHPNMTTRKAIVLITQTFVGKVMALLFNMLSRLVSTLATSWEGLTHWKRPWCWDRLGAGGEGDNRRCGGWMASPTRWTWVWVNSRSWWRAGRPGVLQLMGHKESDTTEQLN